MTLWLTIAKLQYFKQCVVFSETRYVCVYFMIRITTSSSSRCWMASVTIGTWEVLSTHILVHSFTGWQWSKSESTCNLTGTAQR